MSKHARATAIPEAVQPPAPPKWVAVPVPGFDDGADYVVGGVVVVTVRAVVSNDPRRDSWAWATSTRSGRHVGDIDSAKARALDQHARHSG